VVDAITIRIHIDNKQLHFLCANVIDSQKAVIPQANGLGNRLLKQRFDLLYKDRYTLDIQATADRYTVDLRLQLYD
jgi:LytS/YehU family sensor histidine kinase